MKTIGILGGMSWQSTLSYYRLINEGVKRQLGGFHSAKIVLNNVDFEEIESLQRNHDWDATARILCDAARSVEAGGADFLLIATNTMHVVADPIADAITIPLLHIADATGRAIQADGLKRIALLGTRYTMEKEFYRGRLRGDFDLEVLIPDEQQRVRVHQVIYDELCCGKISAASRDAFLNIIADLAGRGAEAVILGCTEIGLLVDAESSVLPLYDTTELHAAAAVAMALEEVVIPPAGNLN